MIEKIHIIMPLFASIIVAIVSVIQKNNISLMCFRLIFTIILFYICGIIVRNKLRKMFDDELFEGLEIYNASTEQEETPKDEE